MATYLMKTVHMFFSVPVVGAFGLLTIPMARSSLSKLTRADQQGMLTE
jgi:hypothetical protein